MRKIYIPFFICLLFLQCNKEEVLIPPEEPDITNPIEEIITGDFAVIIESKTDRSVVLKWYPIEKVYTYDVFINDAFLVQLDRPVAYENYYSYNVVNLQPDTEYKFTVRAISKDLQVKNTSGVVSTLKSLISNIVNIVPDKYDYEFRGCTGFIQTRDEGCLLSYNVNKKGYSYRIFIKVNSSYETEWLCEIPEPGYNAFYTEPYLRIYETDSGDFIMTTEKAVVKVSRSGVLEWKKVVADEEAYFNTSILLPDGNIMLGGYSRRQKERYVVIGYYIVKVSGNGEVIWKNHVDAPNSSYTRRHINSFVYNQETLLAAVWSDNASIVEFDMQGNTLNEYLYMYDDEQSIITFSDILPCEEDNYYLIGRGNSILNKSQVFKINNRGIVLWEKKGDTLAEYMIGEGLSHTVGNNLVLVTVQWRSGYQVKEIDPEGNIKKQYNLSGVSTGISMGQTLTGQYCYVSLYGDIIFINPDGFYTF